MSSQYSPDLRIELIGTGDQAGVWGSTTNNNLAYVLEQAIAGYVSVSVTSANQALTYLNGASAVAADNQAVHANLALTTTTGANFAVYAPPSSKQYTIYNASAYAATIYNSSVIGNTTNAGAGVVIPAGKVMTVWSDGTNFTQQNTHLISPTIASPTLTAPVLGTPASGTLTNASGLPISTGVSGLGTGVATALAVNVGSAGAPVLNGGALGTPSSGTLTNATGLSLTTGVTGILPIANGGVGTSSFTGTGNNVFSNSPTLVTPALGTPSSGNLANCTFPTLNQNTTGTAAGLSATLAVASGGTGVTTSTGSGNNVLSNSPTLVTPALGTPSSGNLANCTFPTLNQSTTGNAATATNPQGGGTFITSSNIGSQSVNYANSAGNGGVTSIAAGNGIAVSGATGAVTISAAAPTENTIGSYILAASTTESGTISPGTTVSATTLRVTGLQSGTTPGYRVIYATMQSTATLSGTWRAMSYSVYYSDCSSAFANGGMFVRVS